MTRLYLIYVNRASLVVVLWLQNCAVVYRMGCCICSRQLAGIPTTLASKPETLIGSRDSAVDSDSD